MKRRTLPALPSRVAADPARWSDASQGSVAAYFTTAYVDVPYKCWHCRTEATFTAADQKYTFEVRKANINQTRRLCVPCWRESLRIADSLVAKRNEWATSKKVLKNDKEFLSEWLHLVEQHETYAPFKSDTARKNMLRRLLEVVTTPGAKPAQEGNR